MNALRLSLLIVILAAPADAGNWPQFRGPFFNGSVDESGLPSQWSTTDNIAWSIDLPGPSAATPAVWGDHVFVTSTDADANALLAMCIDRRTGHALWQHEIAKGTQRTHRSNFASPSPATDGSVAVFFYGSGDMAAFDFAGKELWSRNIQKDYGEFAFLWTFASSPVLFGGKLYLQVLQRDVPVDGRGFADRKNESYLLAMEPKTGKTLWRHVRPSNAVAESREAFNTPMPFETAQRKMLLVAGGDALTGHDPETGDELWRWETWNPDRIPHWRQVVSPVAGDDVVLVCAPKRDPIYAIRLGGKGQLGEDAVAWVSREARDVSSDVPTPTFYDGDFFVLSDVRKSLSRVEPGSGKVRWTVKLPGFPKYEASPLAGDGKIYAVNFAGDVAVIGAEKGDILAEIPMKASPEYPIRSTIVAANGQLFIRLNRKLYCVGRK